MSEDEHPLEQAIDSIDRLQVPQGPPEQLNKNLISELSQETGRRDLRFPGIYRDRLLRYAAGLLLAATAGLCTWFLIVDSRSALAFSDIAEVFQNVQNASFNVTVYTDGHPVRSLEFLVLEPSRLRMTGANGEIVIKNFEDDRIVFLDPVKKQAVIGQGSSEHFGVLIFKDLRDRFAESMLRSESIERLGQKVVTGRRTVGFRYQENNEQMTVWADPKTRLPVRIAMASGAEPESLKVWSDFEFDIEMDQSMFDTRIPEGFKVETIPVDRWADP